MKPMLKALVGVFVLLIASCGASGHWENSKVAREQWPRDEAACKRKAYAEIKKELARDPDYRGFGMDRNDVYKTNMLRYKSDKSQSSVVNSCMRRRGYMKAGKKGWF